MKGSLEEFVRARIQRSIEVKQALLAESELISTVAMVIGDAMAKGSRLIVFGNGGSAADAQHIAAELAGRFYIERRPLPAEALTVNTSALTAISNDYSYDLVFARQVEGTGRPGDIAIGISTSGNSINVIEGLWAARRLSMITIALTGLEGGKLLGEVDYCLRVPSLDVARIQESHILIGHILCEHIEATLFGPDGAVG